MKDGHPIYANIHGNVLIRACLFDECGGNPIQLVNREDSFKHGAPSIENREVEPGRITIRQVYIGESGYADGRGSFPISIVGVGREGRPYNVTLRDWVISCRWPNPGSKGARSRGGPLIEGHGHGHWQFDQVEVVNGAVDLWTPDRQMMCLNNTRSATVIGNSFEVHDGMRYIDYDRQDFDGFAMVKPCGEIVHEGNSGNVQVRSMGKIIGDVNENMTIRNGLRVRPTGRTLPK